jgi:2-amino-4-hydroxy-6-hydroxymethyldihydropteridine diphosphokinase
MIDLPELKVPHPGITERPFVLYPLYECDPDLSIPGNGKVADLLSNCPLTELKKLDGHESA